MSKQDDFMAYRELDFLLAQYFWMNQFVSA